LDQALARDSDGAGPRRAAAATVGEDVEHRRVELRTTAVIYRMAISSRGVHVPSGDGRGEKRRRGEKKGGTDPGVSLARSPMSGQRRMWRGTWFRREPSGRKGSGWKTRSVIRGDCSCRVADGHRNVGRLFDDEKKQPTGDENSIRTGDESGERILLQLEWKEERTVNREDSSDISIPASRNDGMICAQHPSVASDGEGGCKRVNVCVRVDVCLRVCVRVCVWCVCVCVRARERPNAAEAERREAVGDRRAELCMHPHSRTEKAKTRSIRSNPSRRERVGSGPCMVKYKAYDSNLGNQCSGASYRSRPRDAVRMQHFVMNPRRGTEMSHVRSPQGPGRSGPTL
jgi:hypothetical protein